MALWRSAMLRVRTSRLRYAFHAAGWHARGSLAQRAMLPQANAEPSQNLRALCWSLNPEFSPIYGTFTIAALRL